MKTIVLGSLVFIVFLVLTHWRRSSRMKCPFCQGGYIRPFSEVTEHDLDGLYKCTECDKEFY